MELKLGNRQLKRIGFGSLNCTVMELKHDIRTDRWEIAQGLNCTVMELKRGVSLFLYIVLRGLNCTVMELKQPNRF